MSGVRRKLEFSVLAVSLATPFILACWLVLLVLVGRAQTCVPVSYQGNVNSCQGLSIRWLNHNSISDIDHFDIQWADGFTQSLPGSAISASRTGLPCNWS